MEVRTTRQVTLGSEGRRRRGRPPQRPCVVEVADVQIQVLLAIGP